MNATVPAAEWHGRPSQDRIRAIQRYTASDHRGRLWFRMGDNGQLRRLATPAQYETLNKYLDLVCPS